MKKLSFAVFLAAIVTAQTVPQPWLEPYAAKFIAAQKDLNKAAEMYQMKQNAMTAVVNDANKACAAMVKDGVVSMHPAQLGKLLCAPKPEQPKAAAPVVPLPTLPVPATKP